MSKQGGSSNMPIAAIAFHKNINLLAEVRHDVRPLMCLFIRVLDGVSVIYLKDITEAYPLSCYGILVYLSSASSNLEVRALGKTAGLLLTGAAGIEPAT